MTGIKRLRTLAGAWDEWGLGGTIAEMADEIERELREERDRWESDLSEAQVSWTAVAGVCLDMERHVLGHEGMDDSPVARWARELREALRTTMSRHESDAVAGSPYDAMANEDREAAAWVREHGGLGAVQVRVDTLQDTLDWLRGRAGVSKYEIVDYDKLIDSLDRRLMPDGMEWPAFEDGETVRIGDEIQTNVGCITVEAIEFARLYPPTTRDWTVSLKDGEEDNYSTSFSPGGCVKCPARKVLAADGEPLEVGQTVWRITDGMSVTVERFNGATGFIDSDGAPLEARYFTHQRPVLDADGVPIKKGDTVWSIDGDGPLTVESVSPDDDKDKPEDIVWCGEWLYDKLANQTIAAKHRIADQLTHTKPEPPDSWERIEEDARLKPFGYVDRVLGWDMSKSHSQNQARSAMTHDLVRRCRALAERERSE